MPYCHQYKFKDAKQHSRLKFSLQQSTLRQKIKFYFQHPSFHFRRYLYDLDMNFCLKTIKPSPQHQILRFNVKSLLSVFSKMRPKWHTSFEFKLQVLVWTSRLTNSDAQGQACALAAYPVCFVFLISKMAAAVAVICVPREMCIPAHTYH